MDMTMSIAATSVMMSQQQLQQNMSVSLMRNAMNQQAQQALELVEDIKQSVPTGIPGRLLDVLA